MTRAAITAVLDPADDLETQQQLRRAADDSLTTIVVEICPNARRQQPIAEDLLTAMGKDLTRRGAHRNGQESWDQACAWVVGESTRRLIVTRCHVMPSQYIQSFVQLATLAGLELTLVFAGSTYTRGRREALSRLLIPTITIDRLDLSATSASKGCKGEKARPSFTELEQRLPAEDFPAFHSAAKRALTPTEFRLLDAEYQSWVDRALTRWNQRGWTDTDTIAGLLRELFEESHHPAESLIRLRALQTVSFLHGYLITERAGIMMTGGAGLADTAALTSLRRYASTRYAAAGVIALLRPPDPSAIARIRLRDVCPDGSSVRIDDRSHPVPASAAGILRSRRLYRLAGAATLDDGFIDADRRAMQRQDGGSISGPSAILRLLRTVQAETGLPVADRWHCRHAEPAQIWAKRAGYVIQPIPEGLP